MVKEILVAGTWRVGLTMKTLLKMPGAMRECLGSVANPSSCLCTPGRQRGWLWPLGSCHLCGKPELCS